MLITSQEHFTTFVTTLLERAKGNLARDRDMVPTALFSAADGHVIEKAFIGNFEACDVARHIRGVISERPTMEMVVYVTLAVAITAEQFERLQRLPQEHPERMHVIRVEGSHRDFGEVSMHIEFKREAGTFQFEPLVRSVALNEEGTDGALLRNLWPKRTLNS